MTPLALADIPHALLLGQSQNVGNWIQLVFLVLVFGASGLGWLFRILKEKHKQKQLQDQRRRLENEALRTGRPVRLDDETLAGTTRVETTGAPPPPPLPQGPQDVKRRLQELAQRRRAELEELRRRAQAGTAQPSAPPAPRPVPQARPVSPQPGYGPAQSPAEIAERRRRQIRAQREAQAHAQAEARAAAARRQQEQQQRAEAEAHTRRRIAAAQQAAESRADSVAPSSQAQPIVPARTAAGGGATRRGIGSAALGAMPPAGTPEGAAAWRQLIVATEVLGTPVGLRDE